MKIKNINTRTLVLILFMLAIAAWRIILSMLAGSNPLATYTVLGAMTLFGAAYFSKTRAIIFTLAILFISDLILNRFVHYGEWRFLYEGFYWTYGSFALMTLAANSIIKKVSVKTVLMASIVITAIHWIGTSPNCFLIAGSLYTKTVSGYFASLIGALPFERNFLIGTLCYSGILFGCFEWMQRSINPVVKTSRRLQVPGV